VATHEDRGRGNRRGLKFVLVAAVASMFLRVAGESHSAVAGLGAAAAFVAFLVVLLVGTTRRSRRRAAALGPLRLELLLDFDCLPGEWPALALETLPAAAAGHTYGLPVTVEAIDGWLRIAKRASFGNGRHPFTAQVPLAAVREVTAGKSLQTLGGASIIFILDDGSEIRGDLRGSVAETDARLEPFRQAVTEARRRPRFGPSTLEVTSPAPPPRTSPGRAAGLMMASFLPFGAAIIGAPDGPFADVATVCVFFLALGLQMKRPVSMPRLLARAHGLAALAFVVDATRTGQPLRFCGTFLCLCLVAWMMNLQPPRHGVPGPA
jgi:hypothetical protein